MLHTPLASLPVWRHALATPLTTLQLVLDQAQQTPAAPAVQANLLQAREQLTYLRNLLFPAGESRFSLRACLSTTVHRLDCLRERRVTYVDQLTTDVELPGYGIEFQEAISCAVTNGWEAYQSHEHRVVLITCYIKDRNVLVQITDYGRGMNWLTRTTVLHRGLTTKPNHAGIGTTFIKQVIEKQLHGRIIYSSYEGLGTTQTWVIPLPAPDTHSPGQSEPHHGE